MRILLLLASAVASLAVSCSKNNNGGSSIVIVTDPAEKVLSLEASARANYQIYQVNPRLFGNSGQLKAVQGRLDEIKALGTDILYLMPIYTQGSKNSVGSPYCIRDYKGVKAECGTLADVKALVQAAHQKGMKVMFDWVANHTAWDHPWITEHDDWYQKDGKGNIVYPTRDGEWKDVAQLNFSSEALQTAMIDAMKYWITEADIDGYRCDYAHGVPDAFWKKAIPELKAAKSGFIMLAESDFERMFSDGFDIIYDRGLKAAAKALWGGGKIKDFVNAYKNTLDKTPAGKTKCYFVTNHDDCSEKSPVTEFKSKDGAFAAYALLAALNGSPLLYSSQETGYATTINFFQVVSINWSADANLTGRDKTVLSALQKCSRDQACQIFASGSVIYVQYDGAILIGINTGASEAKAKMPAGKNLPQETQFAAYEVKTWNL